MYSFTLPSTSALDGVGGQRHAPAALPPGKTRYPSYRRLRGPQGRSERVRKISPPPGFDPRTVQPVASRLYRLSYLGPYISLTLRLLMSYTYMERLFLMFLDHTQRRSTVGRTPLDE